MPLIYRICYLYWSCVGLNDAATRNVILCHFVVFILHPQKVREVWNNKETASPLLDYYSMEKGGGWMKRQIIYVIVLYNLDYISGYTVCEFFLSYLNPGYRTLQGKVER